MKYLLFLIIILLISCSNVPKEGLCLNKIEMLPDSTKKSIEIKISTFNLSPTYSIGNDSTLLSISGDFDGDGIKETLQEHYFSNKLKKDIPVPSSENGFDFLEDDNVFDKVRDLEPQSFMICSNNQIDTLHLETPEATLGLYYIKNEGDLDGDGGDELSIVISWLQYSTTTFSSILSYKKGEWVELYSFPTWAWAVDEEMNKGGLIRKISNNKIEVKYRSDEGSQETMIVDLSQYNTKQ